MHSGQVSASGGCDIKRLARTAKIAGVCVSVSDRYETYPRKDTPELRNFTPQSPIFTNKMNHLHVGGAPDWIRTSGPQIRNLMLYPAELRVRILMFRRYRLRGSIGLIGRNDR